MLRKKDIRSLPPRATKAALSDLVLSCGNLLGLGSASEESRILTNLIWSMVRKFHSMDPHDRDRNAYGFLSSLRHLICNHGVEFIKPEDIGFRGCDYLNQGDSYEPTILYYKGAIRICSMGDIVEWWSLSHYITD
jgi:hypothetical protein